MKCTLSTILSTLTLPALLVSTAMSQPRIIEDFESLARWKPITTHGDASRLKLLTTRGKQGCAMVMDFAFIGYMGNVMAEGDLPLEFPEDFQFSFDIRAEAKINHFEFRLIDSLGNVYRLFRMDRQANKFPWQAYLPYELRAAGTYLYLDQKNRALELLASYVDDRRPARWNQWPEINLHDPEDPKFIGDMPHSWAGSEYIRTFRSLFVYERELDTALVIGAGIPMDWLDDSAGVRVEHLPTYYGRLSYSLKRQGPGVTLSVEGGVNIPAGGIVFKSLLGRAVQAATINGQAAQVKGDDLVIRAVPAIVAIR